MLAIHASGFYLPNTRVPAGELKAAGKTVPRGLARLPVAAPDEDPLTMAIEAGRAALAGSDDAMLGSIRSLAVASTTLPYTLRVQSGLVAGALRLSPELVLTEHTTSARAGIEALYAAGGGLHLDGGGSDDAGYALVIGAERPRTPGGGGADGAAAAALLIGRGNEGPVGTVDALASYGKEDPGLRFVRRGENAIRDVEVGGYASSALTEALAGAAAHLFRITGAEPGDFQLAALGTLDPRAARTAAGAVGLRQEQWSPIHPFGEVGEAGAVGPLLSLLAALDVAEPGDRILWLAYGAGSAADAVAVTAGPEAGGGLLASALGGGLEIDALQYLKVEED